MATWSGESWAAFSTPFSVRWARGEKLRSSSTNASVLASSSASGTHSTAMPHSWACRAGIRRERIATSLVRAIPIIRTSRAEPPEPGIMPMRCSGSASSAVSETMRKSQASDSSNPTPKQ